MVKGKKKKKKRRKGGEDVEGKGEIDMGLIII